MGEAVDADAGEIEPCGLRRGGEAALERRAVGQPGLAVLVGKLGDAAMALKLSATRAISSLELTATASNTPSCICRAAASSVDSGRVMPRARNQVPASSSARPANPMAASVPNSAPYGDIAPDRR
jgi:hypothetical protein